jgi:hypothetical protein
MNRLNKEAHALEDINGVRCAVVEKNVSPERVEFLKQLLEFNGYTVMVAPSPPPKVIVKPVPPAPKVEATPLLVPEQKVEVTDPPHVTPAPAAKVEVPTPSTVPSPPPTPAPETFTVGVTDFLFHAMLAIYERALKTPEGKFVTVDYWNQQPEKEDKYYWKRDFFTNSL